MHQTIPTQPFPDQQPGTSGLRKKTTVFMQPHYLENFVESVLLAQPDLRGGTLILGGDGRFHNDIAVQTILRMAAAHGVARVIVGADGLLSTPAASHLIRRNGAAGGLILSASHNPGGKAGDFGIKFNLPNGGPATEAITQAIAATTRTLTAYHTIDHADLDLHTPGVQRLGNMIVEVIDPVADYAQLMGELFDFDAIRDWLRSHRVRLDALHAVAGPYLRSIFGLHLGVPEASLLHTQPQPDFGGHHPDPNPAHCAALVDALLKADAPDFAAAFDGDADRNMILGRGIVVTPSDSLAILAANAHRLPQFRHGLPGVARSMPTSRAVDAVAAALGIDCYETPTGWKYFGTLLDVGRISLCGEESYGTGAAHVREKDGVWAALAWLNLLAVRRQSVAEIVHAHWAQFGRNVYARHDYEALPTDAAARLIEGLRAALPRLAGETIEGLTIVSADEFAYTDPVDGSTAQRQGLRIELAGGGRIVYRLSGTGTEGATLRVYLEWPHRDASRFHEPATVTLAPLARAARQLAGIEAFTGRSSPDVIS